MSRIRYPYSLKVTRNKARIASDASSMPVTTMYSTSACPLRPDGLNKFTRIAMPSPHMTQSKLIFDPRKTCSYGAVNCINFSSGIQITFPRIRDNHECGRRTVSDGPNSMLRNFNPCGRGAVRRDRYGRSVAARSAPPTMNCGTVATFGGGIQSDRKLLFVGRARPAVSAGLPADLFPDGGKPRGRSRPTIQNKVRPVAGA